MSMSDKTSRRLFKLEEESQQQSQIISRIRCALWNVCSINNKLSDIMEHILDCNLDVVFLRETWLQTDENAITAEAKTYGYEILHNRRKDREKERGGGVRVLVRNKISAKQQKSKHYSSLEYTVVQIKLCSKKSLFLISLYRLHRKR